MPFVEINKIDDQLEITFSLKTIAMGMMWKLFGSVAIIFIVYWYYFGQVFIRKPVLTGSYFRKKIIIKGISRKYSFYVPSSISQNTSLIFILHGASDVGDRFRRRLSYRWDELADNEGLLAVYPSGY